MTIEYVSKRCKLYREQLGKTQKDVARDLGYSPENVSSFETGRNNNMIILLWYIQHGMTYEFLNNEAGDFYECQR